VVVITVLKVAVPAAEVVVIIVTVIKVLVAIKMVTKRHS
jgi:hypothetical protein